MAELSPAEVGRRTKAQRLRIIYCIKQMREMETKATFHFNKFNQRRDEIAARVEWEYRDGRRATLGSSKEHLIDEEIGKDTTAAGHAGNNKWYISQATMYSGMAAVELEALKLGILAPIE